MSIIALINLFIFPLCLLGFIYSIKKDLVGLGVPSLIIGVISFVIIFIFMGNVFDKVSERIYPRIDYDENNQIVYAIYEYKGEEKTEKINVNFNDLKPGLEWYVEYNMNFYGYKLNKSTIVFKKPKNIVKSVDYSKKTEEKTEEKKKDPEIKEKIKSNLIEL